MNNLPLSNIGIIIDKEIQKLSIYPTVRLDKYSIMPDRIHFIISINTYKNGHLGERLYKEVEIYRFYFLFSARK